MNLQSIILFFENENNWPEILSAYDLLQKIRRIHKSPIDFEEGDLTERILRYDGFKLRKIPLSKLDLDEWAINDDVVDEYVEYLKKNPDYPPIIVGYRANTIIDGTHRANALVKAGHTQILAYVPIPRKRNASI